MANDSITFLRELRTSFKSIGAMCPSSPMLGRTMASPVRKQGRPINILEVGPGTGPVTRQILRFMGPQDRFLICELNHRFITRLQHTLQKNRHFVRNRDRIDFYEGPIQGLYRRFFVESPAASGNGSNGAGSNGSGEFGTENGSNGHSRVVNGTNGGSPIVAAGPIVNGDLSKHKLAEYNLNGGHHESSGRDGSLYRSWPSQSFDVIVSTLPFSNFTPEMVDEVLSIFRSMLAENGIVSFVEYFMIRKVSLLFASPEDRARIKAVDQVIQRWANIAEAEGEVKKKLSLINIPPALSIQLRYGDEIGAVPERAASNL